MVLVSKENKRKIFEYLLAEGVLVVKKDSYLPKHQNLTDVPNLQVMMIVKSLKSRGFVQEVFCWQWAYYTITNKGVQYLVKELCKFQPILNDFSSPRRHRARYLQEEEGNHLH
jgi:predicted N-acyltransferase